MSKVIGVITARMTSTRLPRKVLAEISSKSNFAHHVERMKNIKGLDGVFLATSVDPKNSDLIEEAERLGCGWYCGPELDIVARHIELCQREEADAVIRVTCDCPLFNIGISSEFVSAFKREYFDFIYCSNMTMIQGTLSELISYNALVAVHKNYKGAAISLPIRQNLGEFKTLGLEISTDLCRPEYRLTVDEPSDLELIRAVYNALYKGKPIDLFEVYTWLDDNPEIANINKNAEIKGCNIYAATLAEKPFYSIVKSGNKHVILDKKKRSITPSDFIKQFSEMFPEIVCTTNVSGEESGN